MASDESAIKALFTLLAVAFLSAAALLFATEGTLRSRKVLLAGVPGIVFFFAGFYWSSLAAAVGPQLANSAVSLASDFKVWLGLFLIVWLYAAVSSIVLLIQRNALASVVKDDIVPFRLALERWVLPRRLVPEQITAISAYLQMFQPSAVRFTVAQYDEEVGTYRADLQRALTAGGWHILGTDYEAAIQEGVHIHFKQTQATAQRPDDPKQPKPDRILWDALRQAGVQVDGMGSGSGVSVTTDLLTITIGKRRRDTSGHRQKWPFGP
jgi:hypothetical protein